jgi:hypothetical protein
VTGPVVRPGLGVLALARPHRIRSPAPRGAPANEMCKESRTTITFLRHRVADYATWRRVYDSVADMQHQGGVTEEAVYSAEGAPTTFW